MATESVLWNGEAKHKKATEAIKYEVEGLCREIQWCDGPINKGNGQASTHDMCPRIDPFIVKCKERIEAMNYIVGRLSVGRKDGWISDEIMTPIVFRV